MYRQGATKSSKLLKSLVVSLAIASISTTAYLVLHKNSPVPADIKKQVSFLVYYPDKGSLALPDKTSFKYDDASKVLSYKIYLGNVSMTVAEQATPQNFVDIPEAYNKLIESLNGYKQFDSLYGTVNLTHPKEFKGEQSAALNAKGTLMFIHPTNGKLSDDQWRQLFNNLRILK